MGSYPREYSTPPSAMPRLTPVTKWLVISNLAIFFADMFLFHYRLVEFSAFTVQSALYEGRVWEFVTFQFMHGSLGHVGLNCLGLYFFGPWMERWWGSLRFLAFYLLCGAAGALFFSVLALLHILPENGLVPLAQVPLVGASAGFYGILVGIALVAPDLRVQLLFPPVELSIRTLALGVLAIAVGSILFRFGGNEGGEAGHLGGAILGFLLMKFPFLLGKGNAGVLRPIRPNRRPGEPKLKPRTSVDLHTSNEIDRILDKINREGLQSLTDEERDTLRSASEK